MPRTQRSDSIISNNLLNTAFIAQNPRQVDTSSIASSIHDSPALSISSISLNSAKFQRPKQQDNFILDELEMNDMDSWSLQSPNFFNIQRNRTRTMEDIDRKNSNDDQELEQMSKCKKKRVGKDNKIITVNPTMNFRKKVVENNEISHFGVCSVYRNDSCQEQVKQIIAQIESKKKFANKILEEECSIGLNEKWL